MSDAGSGRTRVDVGIGGTFTDLVLHAAGASRASQLVSTWERLKGRSERFRPPSSRVAKR